MKKGKSANKLLLSKLLYNNFFKIIYLIIIFFIFIGEFTKKALFFFIHLLKYIFSIIIFIFKKLIAAATNILQFINPKPFFKYIVKVINKVSKSFRFKLHFIKKKRGPKPDYKKRIPPLVFFVIKLRFFFLGSILTLTIFFIIQSYNFVMNLPSPENIGKVNYALSTHIYSRNNKLLYEVYREQNRTPILLEDLPDYALDATIAIEDKAFYSHKGISVFSGMLRAAKEMLIEKKDLQGGSTITQQLVKSSLLTPERTIERKVKEIILAIWAERIYSKHEILEMYLNQVPYGGSAYGIEEASKIYFGKNAKDLTLSESALLAGLPQAPSSYSPFINPKAAVKRRNDVLKNMYEQKYIDEKTLEKELKALIKVIPPKISIKAPHFVFYVKSLLIDVYGIKQVEEGGLNVTTTLDLKAQKKVEEILNEEIDKIRNLNVSNGAVLVTKPDTGEILAMAGSVDYYEEPNGAYNVTTALRQPGSSIKPIMYSLALLNEYTPATIISDTPISFNLPGSSYRPVNYDSSYHGLVPLRYALANSYNIPAVRVLNNIGVQNFVDHAKNMGITTWNNSSRFGLSLTLGGGEVKMIDMAQAFGVFANLGYRQDIKSILKVQSIANKSLMEISSRRVKVLDERVAYIMSDILSDNFARKFAFGSKSDLVIEGYKTAVKTGTTDNKRDNWTIGYTPEYLVVVWVGNNNNASMNQHIASGLTGASPIWHRVMEYLLTEYSTSNTWFPKPNGIVEKKCYFGKQELFLQGTENKDTCKGYIMNQKPKVSPTKPDEKDN